MGRANLEDIVSSKNYVFDKVDISYISSFNNNIKACRNFFSWRKLNNSSFVTCFYCMGKVILLETAKIENYMFLMVKWNGFQNMLKRNLTLFDPYFVV